MLQAMRKDAAYNRQAVVAAAKRLYIEEGSGVSMRAIAREAGVGVATATRHFPDRVTLCEAVFEQVFGEAKRIVDAHVASFEQDPDGAWREAVHGIVSLQIPALAQAIFTELARENGLAEIRARFDRAAEARVSELYAPLLEKAGEAGLCKKELDPLRFHLALAAVSSTLPVTGWLGEQYADQQDYVADVFLDGLKAQAE